MAEHDGQLRTDLSLAEERLSERTRQYDEVKLRIVRKDEQLLAVRSELAESTRQQRETDYSLSVSNALLESKDLELAERTAYLAAAALDLAQRTNQLHESNRYLINKTVELEQTNIELKAMMQQRDDFVAALTHDLKNPLIGTTKILEFLAGGGVVPHEQQIGLFSQLGESNKSMLRMIWNLLEVYRHESGSLVAANESVDVAALLQHCLDEFSFSIMTKRLHVCLDVQENFPSIQSDKILLRRVLINLLDNAVKFTPEAGQLHLGTSRDNHTLRIYVKDSGPGMSEEQSKRMFQRFWQSEHGRDHGIGTGLGLFLSKQIMQVLGGSIECESVLGVGTKFMITLHVRGHAANISPAGG